MTPKQLRGQLAREHMARSAEAVLAAIKVTGKARATEIAAKAGVSVHQARASLHALQADGLVMREKGDGYQVPTLWSVLIDGHELPAEYVKVGSIFRVGDRVARLMRAH